MVHDLRPENKKTINLTKCESFEIRRNNSLIVNNPKEKQICNIDTNGNLYLILSSLYVPDINRHVIKKNLSSFKYVNVEKFEGKDNTYVDLMFIDQDDKDAMYSVLFVDDNEKILKMIEKNVGKNKEANGWTADTNPRILNHHYGDLVIFTPKLLKQMEKGKKYYIVLGQNWDADYDGHYSIYVLDYEGYHKGDDINGYSLYGTMTNEADGKQKLQSSLNDGPPFSIISANSDEEYFYTGTGIDPVHLITQFREGFKVPKKISHLGAQLFNYSE